MDKVEEPEEESIETLVAELAANPEEDVPEQVGDLDKGHVAAKASPCSR